MNEQYSPEVLAFLEAEAAKETMFNGPRLNPLKVRLVGKNPQKPDPTKEGTFRAKEFSEVEKKYQEEKPFGPEPHNKFSGIILDWTYYAAWKYAEKRTETYRTREIHDFKEPIEMLKMEFGDGKAKTSVFKTFGSYAEFRDAFCGPDPVTHMERNSPYDLLAALYIWQPATKQIVKYEVKGMTRSAFFDYQKAWMKAISEAKTIKNVVTEFGVTTDEKGFVGTFFPRGMASAEMMNEVIIAHKDLKAWQEEWKKMQKSPVIEEPKVEHVDEGYAHPMIEEEINVDDIPF